MFDLFRKRKESLLGVIVNGIEICNVKEDEIPFDMPTLQLSCGSNTEFVDYTGVSHYLKFRIIGL